MTAAFHWPELILLAGPPGSGKSTLGRQLAAHFQMPHLSMGDLFRQLDPFSVVGRMHDDLARAGTLMPDDLALSVLDDALHDLPDAYVILDGFPRTAAQVDLLSRLARVHTLLVLECPDELCLHRVLTRAVHDLDGQRTDGHETVVKRRLETYHTQTRPALTSLTCGPCHHLSSAVTPDALLASVLQRLYFHLDLRRKPVHEHPVP